MTHFSALEVTAVTARASARAAMRFNIVVHENLADAETEWRRLEARGILTPYQSFDWISGLLAAGAEPNGRMAVAVIRNHGQAVALLPLLIENQYGARRARMIGMHQSNSDWLLALPGFHPTAAELKTLFRQIGRAVGGVDFVMLLNQPKTWQGAANPILALPHAPAPSNLYTTTIGGTPVPYVDHRLVTKRRSNINRGRRRLEELLGPVRLVRIRDSAELDKVHAEFLSQRGARFATMGLDNIFAQGPFPQFFRAMAIASFDSPRPVLCAHALMAGDEIVATSWGTTAHNHYSQYINSTSSGPAGKYSLMGILVAELMDELTQSGIETFDMGLGDFDYKHEWTEPQVVFDTLLPLTLKGRIATTIMQQRGAFKRLIKQTPAFWRAARWLRGQLFRLKQR